MTSPLPNRAAILLLALCGIVAAQATTIVPPTFEEMAARADLIFVGTATNSRSEWRTNGTDRAIFTLVTFNTQEVLKGPQTPSVTLQFLGGTMGEVSLDVAGVPRFFSGERVILFVENNGAQFCPLVGVFHGKFAIKRDEKTGREIVVMHDGRPLKDVAEIGTGEGADLRRNPAVPLITGSVEPMTLEGFKSAIRNHLAKSPPTK
jgi:hypothetical protein